MADPSLPTVPSPLPPGHAPVPPQGSKIGRFVILAPLGAGGMGIVVSAWDPKLSRRIAIKLLQDTSKGTDNSERLLREAQSMARLSHPNVLPIYDAGTHEGRVFLAMELVEGADVATWLKSPRSWRDALDVFRQAGHGLAAAHREGIVHRDFKPANILVGNDGRVKVMDFGLASPVDSATPEPLAKSRESDDEKITGSDITFNPESLKKSLTEPGALVGTPFFMAPEQLLRTVADERSDQFAFCVALHEGLYGTRPFKGETVGELLRSIEAGAPAEPENTSVPGWVRGIILRGLSVKKEDRYPNLDALLADLERDPAIARRRAALVGVAILLPVLAVAGYAQFLDPSRACAGGERQLSGVWDGARKDTVLASFEATKKPFARKAWQRVERSLDSYTERWSAMRVDACEATLRGEQSPALLDLRMVCLSQRLEEVRATVNLLSKADAQIVERSVAVTEGMSSLATCADSELLVSRAAVPEGIDRAALLDAQKQVAEAHVYWKSGKSKEGIPLARSAQKKGAELRYPQLEAEAFYRLARLQFVEFDTRSALESAHAAAQRAEIARDIDLKAQIWTYLITLAAWSNPGDESVAEWTRYAEAAVVAAGDRPERRAELETGIGFALTLQGHPHEGIAHLKRALLEWEKVPDAGYPAAETLAYLGQAYFEDGRYEEALDYDKKALDAYKSALGPEHPTLAAAMGNFAVALAGAGRLEEALALDFQALALLEASVGPTNTRTAHAHMDIANVYLRLGKLDEAVASAERAIPILEENRDANLPMVLALVGDARRRQKKWDLALQSLGRADAAYIDRYGADSPLAFQSAFATGRLWLDRGEPGKAVGPLERALRLRAKGSGDSLDLPRIRFALALALMEGGIDAQRAVSLANEARAAFAAAGPFAKADLARVDDWLASP